MTFIRWEKRETKGEQDTTPPNGSATTTNEQKDSTKNSPNHQRNKTHTTTKTKKS